LRRLAHTKLFNLKSVVVDWQVRQGRMVLDPFVGTGSLLVAAAAVGAVTVGADIDMRVIRIGKVQSRVIVSAIIYSARHLLR